MADDVCLACHGTGMQADDEGWKYECSVCHGTGESNKKSAAKVMSVDENNRLLD